MAADAELHKTTLLRNNVNEEEIAEVVSKWTGIPISKMLEGERDKLLRMENAIQERVVGQGEAVKADRKSTRLNSSHTVISYAVFCLKKKKKQKKKQKQ